MNHWINTIGKAFEDIRTWNDPHTKLHVYKNHQKENIGDYMSTRIIGGGGIFRKGLKEKKEKQTKIQTKGKQNKPR